MPRALRGYRVSNLRILAKLSAHGFAQLLLANLRKDAPVTAVHALTTAQIIGSAAKCAASFLLVAYDADGSLCLSTSALIF
jgi:hypothetical protein